jgi:YVTN family beta-propeller protein
VEQLTRALGNTFGDGRTIPITLACYAILRENFMTPAASAWLRPRFLLSWRIFAILPLAAPVCAQAGRAYVSNEDGQSVTVLDTATGDVVTTVNVGKRPRGLKLSPDGKRLYVAVSGLPKCPPSVPDEECAKLKHDLAADGIAIIDTTTLKLASVLKAGSDPEQFDVSRDGHRLFISNEDSATLSVLDVATGALVATVPVGAEPEGVRVTPDGRSILVTSESANAISVVDAGSLKLLKSIAVGKRPRDVAISPDSRTAYISGEADASLYTTTLADGAPATRLMQFRSEDRPMGVVLDAHRKRLYVSTGRGGTVAVVDLQGPKLLEEVPVGARPWGIALAHDGRTLYTANGSSNDVTVIDTGTLKVLRKIKVGSSPWGIVLSR